MQSWTAYFLFLPHFDVIRYLLLNRRTATWNLFVNQSHSNVTSISQNAMLLSWALTMNACYALDPTNLFCKGYSLCKMVDFQHRLISRIFGISSSFFCAQNYSNVNTESILTCFREFKFLAQIEYFAKAIAFARWPIFNIVSFLEHLVFSRDVFCK